MSPFGRTVRATKAILMAIALSPLAGMSLAADEEPYPIWWSPKLELESLEKVDQRLERSFWPDDEGFVMKKWDVDRYSAKDPAPNCPALLDLAEQGYQGTPFKLHMALMAECEALRYLKNARPAKRSYLAGFMLNHEAFEFLPHMVYFGGSCSSACARYYANEERIPMGEPEPLTELETASDQEMTFETDHESFTMEILARADFNRDGFEDILLRSSYYIFKATGGGTRLFLLTRDAPESVLRVVNPDRHLCTRYQCDPAYYYDQE